MRNLQFVIQPRKYRRRSRTRRSEFERPVPQSVSFLRTAYLDIEVERRRTHPLVIEGRLAAGQTPPFFKKLYTTVHHATHHRRGPCDAPQSRTMRRTTFEDHATHHSRRRQIFVRLRWCLFDASLPEINRTLFPPLRNFDGVDCRRNFDCYSERKRHRKQQRNLDTAWRGL